MPSLFASTGAVKSSPLTKQCQPEFRVILLLSQLGYICFLFSNDAELVVRAANVGSHFLVNNILVAIFILLWVHGHFWMGEIFLIINSLNLTSLYFRHSRMPFFAHLSVVAGPKAWNTVALFTNGAAMVNAQSLPARIVANVFIWSLLLYGNFFVAAFQDYVMGVAMVVLLTGKAYFKPNWLQITENRNSTCSPTVLD